MRWATLPIKGGVTWGARKKNQGFMLVLALAVRQAYRFPRAAGSGALGRTPLVVRDQPLAQGNGIVLRITEGAIEGEHVGIAGAHQQAQLGAAARQ
jgi:hypothetical protein